MNNTIFILCFLLLSVPVMQCTNVPWKYNGTSPGLKDMIIGRCYEFKEFSHLNRLKDFSVTVDCATVWNEFKTSFANKDICEITENDYDGLFALLNDTGKTSKLLFWSGTRTIAHDFSHVNDHYATLEDTFPGYIANELRWCGCNNCSTGIDYKMCNKSCPNNAYWSRASTNLAKKATGAAYVLVNGTARGRNTAYYRGSFFGKAELPTLGKLKQINKLIVLVALDLDVEPKEKCGQGTLIDLVSDAKHYGISEVECQDNPIIVFSILCAKYPHAEQCKKKSWSLPLIEIIFNALCIAFLLTIVGLIIVLLKQRKRLMRNIRKCDSIS